MLSSTPILGFCLVLAFLCVLSTSEHSDHEYNYKSDALANVIDHEVVHNNSDLHRDNLRKAFSWSDPLLNALLWGGAQNVPDQTHWNGARQITKRAQNVFGPAISFNCLFCDNKRVNNPALTLGEFDMYAMIAKAIQPIRKDLSCLFYAQRPTGSDPYTLGPTATRFACANGLRTIWMMWPYNKEACTEENYYCLYEQCCWLHPILGTGTPEEQQANRLTYFIAMSEAIANTCRGDVFLMTDDVNRVPTSQYPYPIGDQVLFNYDGKPANPSIWLRDELPMLRSLKEHGKLNDFYAISVDGSTRIQHTNVLTYPQWPMPLWPPLGRRDGDVNISSVEANEAIKKFNREFPAREARRQKLIALGEEIERDYLALPEEVRERLEHKARLALRADSCGGATDYQPPNEDWFG